MAEEPKEIDPQTFDEASQLATAVDNLCQGKSGVAIAWMLGQIAGGWLYGKSPGDAATFWRSVNISVLSRQQAIAEFVSGNQPPPNEKPN